MNQQQKRPTRLFQAIAFSAMTLIGACSASTDGTQASVTSADSTAKLSGEQNTSSTQATVVFAGGCFWCMEKPFDDLEGVISTVSGYAGGHVVNPNYRQVTAGNTGHLEVVQVTYNPTLVSFEQLLATYWVNVDPLDDGGQFCDRGSSYKTAVFVQNAEQRAIATASKAAQAKLLNAGIVTPINDLSPDEFYPAEDYHQNYYLENPLRYQFYRSSCRRDARLQELWGSAAAH